MDEDKIFKLRQILNIIFMLGAVAGIIVYFAFDHFFGTVTILAAMVFKMIEYIIRFMRPKR